MCTVTTCTAERALQSALHMQRALQSVHCTTCTAKCALHNVHCTTCTAKRALHNVHCTTCTESCAQQQNLTHTFSKDFPNLQAGLPRNGFYFIQNSLWVVFRKQNSVKSISERFVLAVCVAKFGPLGESIRIKMLLFSCRPVEPLNNYS